MENGKRTVYAIFHNSPNLHFPNVSQALDLAAFSCDGHSSLVSVQVICALKFPRYKNIACINLFIIISANLTLHDDNKLLIAEISRRRTLASLAASL